MSVYTRINRVQLESFLQTYSLGQLLNYAGIADGIENTNYLLTTTQGEFVLTLFERFSHQELGYFLDLLQHLQPLGFESPQPQISNAGALLYELASKPAVVFKRIPGRSVDNPTLSQCQQVGAKLAELHRSGANFKTVRKNQMDLQWCAQVTDRVRPYLKVGDYTLMMAELEFQAGYSQVQLPQGLIHGDLFKDNVLFVDDKLTGILDFYNACHDSLLLDLAITANDWCHEADGQINHEKLNGLLASYRQIRALTTTELDMLTIMLRAAALRFWLSRLEHQIFRRAGDLVQEKDPLVYRRILRQYQSGR